MCVCMYVCVYIPFKRYFTYVVPHPILRFTVAGPLPEAYYPVVWKSF